MKGEPLGSEEDMKEAATSKEAEEFENTEIDPLLHDYWGKRWGKSPSDQ